MFTKSSHWSYEREWRIFQYKKGAGVYTVPARSLVQVILGAEVDPKNAAMVRQWVSDAPNKISITSALLSPVKFKVEIEGAWRGDA